MNSLELKIPPPAVAALVAAIMWGISLITPLLEVALFTRVSAAIMFALAGSGFSLAGVISFRRAKTTVNPMKPETATSLVSTGIYRVTRNPMYVGLLLVLIAWAAYLTSAWALLGPLGFVLYISRFQIAPEERVLSTLFGAEYTAYQSKVRRWL
ncbi:MAG: isoprenylcysteine carboxylmethyltransferase family protein [Gallionella sp.]|jgi:protein-S-isoprenylcysteine O-methyltransferase Ste14